MTLLDDTPTANPDTMKWITEEVLLPTEGGEGQAPAQSYEAPQAAAAPPPPPPPPAQVALDSEPPSMEEEEAGEDKDAFDKALASARSGRLDEAVQTVTEALSRERTGRGRYKRRMQLAHLFVAAQKQKIAYPMLRELAAEIDRRQLEDWESGEVLAHPLVLLMQCMEAVGGDQAQKAELYDRICRLDPVQALNYQE
jgi:type VI secretion system protein ImpA